MAYFCAPAESGLQMALVRSSSHCDPPTRSYAVLPPYAAFEDVPQSHAPKIFGPPRSYGGMSQVAGFSSRHEEFHHKVPCQPCFDDCYDRNAVVVHRIPKTRSQTFTQSCNNPVIVRSDSQQAVVPKATDIPLYNSLEDPHLEEYYRRKFTVYRDDRRPKTSTATGSGRCCVDACAVYKVIIATGDKSNAGTYANVYLRMNGSKGKLNKIRLQKPLKEGRKSHHRSRTFHFSPGSVHSFKVYAPDLGDLRSILLEHDGLEKVDSWFVEYVEVANITRGYTWHFSCNDWLSAYKSDGKICRELYSERIEVTNYEIVVITGDRDKAETDANVFITLFGKKGHTDRIALKNRKRWCFRRGQTDRFVVRARNVGRMKKIRIEHDNSGLSPSWFIERIVVCNCDDPRERYFFACGCWLSIDHEDGVISREFLASLHPFDGRKERRYKILTYTGKQSDAGTDSDIFIQLIGELSSSESLRLETPYLRLFERGSEDAFLMRIPGVGVLRKLRIRNCNNGIHPGWFLMKVIVEDLDDNRIYTFPCRRWIGGDRSRGHVWVELVPGEWKDKDYDAYKDSIDWHFRIYTSDIQNAGTDAHVFVQLYGDRGKTKIIRFEGAGAKFETGVMDDIHVKAEDIGIPYKLRVWHDDKGLAPGWHLDKVQLSTRGRNYVFPCKQWLAKDESDGEIVRELPATGDRIDYPLPVLEYQVTVVTGDKFGAGTDANVFICLNGERGDTGERQLSKSQNINKFEKGNTDTFIIKAVELKRIKSVRIGHDNSGAAAGWFLDKVIVKELSGKTGQEQVFPCGRWFATDEDDGQISRELTEFGAQELTKFSYEVSVKTGDVLGAGTDANAFITICGEKAESMCLPLKMSETSKHNKFERNEIDRFLYQLDILGKLFQVKVRQDGGGVGADWYLEEIVTFVPQDGLEYTCPARRWIKASDGEVVLPVTSIKEVDKGDTLSEEALSDFVRNYSQAAPYEITIWTGTKTGSGTDANVFVQLYGLEGKKTDEIKLDNRSNNFETGKKERFKFNAADVGSIQKLRVGHDNSGAGPGWFLDKIMLQRVRARSQSRNLDSRRDSFATEPEVETYWFFVNRWFAKDEDDKQIVRTMLPQDENGRYLSGLDLASYELHVFTGDILGAGTDSTVSVNIFGENGESGLIDLKDSLLKDTSGIRNKFERNREDVFLLKDIPYLGQILRKLHIRTDASGVGSDWYLSHVDIIDQKTNQTWFFRCNDWLGKGRDKTVFKDLPALRPHEKERILSRKGSSAVSNQTLEEASNLTTYNLEVVTGTKFGAGTDANVYMIIYGEEQTTDELWLKNSKTHARNKFENGNKDVFEFKLMDIGDVRKIKLGHDNAGGGADWYVERVSIEAPRLGRRWQFPIKQWFSKSKGDHKLERELYPQALATEDYVPHVPYEITVVTSRKRGAGTDASVFINIYGPDGNTGDKPLCSSKEERQKRFEDGSIDTFVIELGDVGNNIDKIRIGHDNSGFGPGWHLDHVEVRKFISDPRTGELSTTDKRMWHFPCDNWFDKKEGDKKIVRELTPGRVADEFVGRDGQIKQREHVVQEHEKAKHANYKVRVYTGDKSGAGSDANVFVTFFSEASDTGEHKLSKSQNMNKFERAQMDEFEISSLHIGTPIKCKIRQDNSSLFKSAWYLDRVEMDDPVEGRTYTFHCERWLSSSHDDKKIERTLREKNYDGDLTSLTSSRATLRRGGSQLSVDSTSTRGRKSAMIEEEPTGPVIPYTISIRTGREANAGTRANAWCRLFGPPPPKYSRGRDRSPQDIVKTGRIFLSPWKGNGFLPGSNETMEVQAADVGDIHEIELGHDGETEGSGWFVEEVTVEAPTKGRRYAIPFNNWLAKEHGDGRTVRQVPVSDHLQSSFKPKVPYEVTFVTGDVPDAGLGCDVKFTLFGEAKSTGEVVVEKTADRFERASKDTIKLELEDIGKPIRLRVTHANKTDRNDWFLDQVVVTNMKTMEPTQFNCSQWLSAKRGEKKLVQDLVPTTRGGRDLLAKVTYKVHVKTSSMSGAGTSARVFATIFGQNGDTGEVRLKNPESGGSPFQSGREDVFSLNDIYSLGELIKMRVWHDNSGFGSSWHLDSIRVLDTNKNKWYNFPCNRWLSTSEDDKQTVRELACASPAASTESYRRGETEYEIRLVTSDMAGSASVHNAWVILHGENGSSKEYVFENTLRNQILRPGQTDSFKVRSRQLGKLHKVTLGLVKGDQPVAERDRWQCQEVVVTDLASGNKYIFPCNEFIAATRRISAYDGLELRLKNVEAGIVQSVRSSQPTKYGISVVTGQSGTDANVSITIYGELGDTGKRELKKKWKDLFEKGNTDTFTIEALDLGELTKIKIEHDNTSWNKNWFLDRVEINNEGTGRK